MMAIVIPQTIKADISDGMAATCRPNDAGGNGVLRRLALRMQRILIHIDELLRQAAIGPARATLVSCWEISHNRRHVI